MVDNIHVHDNEVRGNAGTSGVVQDNGDPGVFDRVRFEGNRYLGPHEWEWRDRSPDWDAWRSYGNDATGSYSP